MRIGCQQTATPRWLPPGSNQGNVATAHDCSSSVAGQEWAAYGPASLCTRAATQFQSQIEARSRRPSGRIARRRFEETSPFLLREPPQLPALPLRCLSPNSPYADEQFLIHSTELNGVNSFARSLRLSVLRTQKPKFRDSTCPTGHWAERP